MTLLDVLASLFARSASPDAVRAEIFFLGNRYRGEPLAGAIEELRAPSLGRDRERLLRAVVASLTRTAELA
jgi:hypothetical protein